MQTLTIIRFILGFLLLFLGVLVFLLEVIGVYKFKYVLNRMHSAAIGDTLGIGCAMIGIMILEGFTFTTLKFFLVLLFLWFSSPAASHLIARTEVTINENLADYVEVCPEDSTENMTVSTVSEEPLRDEVDDSKDSKEVFNG